MKQMVTQNKKKISAAVAGSSTSALLFWVLGPDVSSVIPQAPAVVVAAATGLLTLIASVLIPDDMEA